MICTLRKGTELLLVFGINEKFTKDKARVFSVVFVSNLQLCTN